MLGWRRGLLLASFPLNLCGLFLAIGSGHLPPGAGLSAGMALALGLALMAPSAALMLLGLRWGDPEPPDEDDEGPAPFGAE